MEINRNCPTTPSFDDLKPPIFTPRECSSTTHPNAYALNLTHITDLHTPINSLSLNEQLRLERDIAHQSSVKTRDSFTTTYSSLQTMLSQMQLKVAAAYLQETEYLKEREERLEYEERLLSEHQNQLDNVRHERKCVEEDFIRMKDRVESAVIQVSKFKTDGAELFQTLFSESRQIDERLSDLISESMESLVRSRCIIQSKNKNFIEKSEDIRAEFHDRTVLIRHTESAITMMLELINTLNQLNIEHTQDLSIVRADFEKRNEDFTQLSQTLKHNWDIQKELEEIKSLENEKIQLQKDFYDQTLLLEHLQTILGQAILR